MSPNSHIGSWNEDAQEALKPQLDHCPPAGGVNALFPKKLRCQCARCRLNKRIRKGIVSRFGKVKDEPERIPSIRFGPSLLGELAGLIKVSIPVFGVSIVLAAPMFALERDTTRGASPVTIKIKQEYVIRGVSSVVAKVQTRGSHQEKAIAQEVRPELVKVPEIIRPETISPPTNLRVTTGP